MDPIEKCPVDLEEKIIEKCRVYLEEKISELLKIREGDLEEKINKLLKTRERDAQVWAPPFLLGTAGEVIKHLLKKFPHVDSYKADSAALLITLKERKTIDGEEIASRFERIVNRSNNNVHCSSIDDVRDRVALCMELFESYRSLRVNMVECYFILSNFEELVHSFLGRDLALLPPTSPTSPAHPPSSLLPHKKRGGDHV